MGICNGGARLLGWIGALACVLMFSYAQAANEPALISSDDASTLAQAEQSRQAGESAVV